MATHGHRGSTSTILLLDLPTEVLVKIFSYISFEHIGKIRSVCCLFNEVGSSTLNSTFQWLQTLTLHRFQQIKGQMPRRESARRTHPLARECDIIETLHMRLTLLQMTFGKHIERKHCCFFAGEILDEAYRILRYVKTTPNLCRTYKVTDELFDLTTMAMEYFKENVEPGLPEITYFATDFLDYNSFPGGSGVKNSTVENSPANHSEVLMDEPQESSSNNVVLRKKLKRLRLGMKKYNTRLIMLKRELKGCKNQMTDQQKQLVECSTRFEEYDKKMEDSDCKFSAVLQELNKCKTELQYWRSKSPANQLCCTCSSSIAANSKETRPGTDGLAAALSIEAIDDGQLPLPSLPACHQFMPIQSEEDANRLAKQDGDKVDGGQHDKSSSMISTASGSDAKPSKRNREMPEEFAVSKRRKLSAVGIHKLFD